MSYGVNDIAYEHPDGKFWVLRVPTGRLKGTYEVYENGPTVSARRAIIGWRDEKGLSMAIVHCDHLAEALKPPSPDLQGRE